MLEIYPFILETITLIRPLAESICRTDPDLGRQLRRAQSSIALNVAEASYSRGRNQAARFHTAMGSARETLVTHPGPNVSRRASAHVSARQHTTATLTPNPPLQPEHQLQPPLQPEHQLQPPLDLEPEPEPEPAPLAGVLGAVQAGARLTSEMAPRRLYPSASPQFNCATPRGARL